MSSPDKITVKIVWQATKEIFQNAGIDTPVADARLLMQSALGMTREQILMDGDRVVSAEQQEKLQKLIERRLKHEPVSRILGTRAFWKADFKITPATLDPRPDSETLIVAAMHHAKNHDSILDLGTGTGCLLLSLLMEWPKAQGIGLDISVDAVQVAGENARKLGLATRATFIAMDWEKFKAAPFDIVISNPPYIAETERPDLEPEVALYDPPTALFGGLDGLIAYRSLVRIVPDLLKPDGILVLEIGYQQANSVKSILVEGGFDVIEVRLDLAGNERCIVAKKH